MNFDKLTLDKIPFQLSVNIWLELVLLVPVIVFDEDDSIIVTPNDVILLKTKPLQFTMLDSQVALQQVLVILCEQIGLETVFVFNEFHLQNGSHCSQIVD